MDAFGIPISVAKPVGLFYNTISLTGASVNNIKNKRLDFKLGIPIIIFSFLFAIVGAYLSKYIASPIVLLMFVSFLLFSGFMFLFLKTKGSKFSRRYSLFSTFTNWCCCRFNIGYARYWWWWNYFSTFINDGFNPKKITTITAFVVPFLHYPDFLPTGQLAQLIGDY